MDTIYIRIKELREHRNMSQQELAELTGYTDRSSIAKIEAGKVDLTQSKVIAIAKALRTTPAYLMGWEEELKEEYTEEELSETKKRLIEKIKDLDEGTIAALNQIADTIIESRQ